MEEFVNVFEETEELDKEMVSSLLRRSGYTLYNDVLLLLTLITGIVMLVISYDSVTFALGVVAVILPTINIFMYFAIRRMHLKRWQEYSKLCHDPKIVNKIKDQVLTMYTADGEEINHFSMEYVEDYYESKNCFYITFKGMMIVPLSKTGFEEGSAEEYVQYISGYQKKKPGRPLVFGLALLMIMAACILEVVW